MVLNMGNGTWEMLQVTWVWGTGRSACGKRFRLKKLHLTYLFFFGKPVLIPNDDGFRWGVDDGFRFSKAPVSVFEMGRFLFRIVATDDDSLVFNCAIFVTNFGREGLPHAKPALVSWLTPMRARANVRVAPFFAVVSDHVVAIRWRVVMLYQVANKQLFPQWPPIFLVNGKEGSIQFNHCFWFILFQWIHWANITT